MIIKTLDSSNALSEGCELWITSNAMDGVLASQLDWYLNGQITRSQSHQPREFDHVLEEILKEENLSAPQIPLETERPLLIPSHSFLPNKAVLLVGFAPLGSCLKQVHEIADGLQIKSLRFFPPATMSTDKFKDSAKSELKDFSVEVVPNTLEYPT